MSKIFFNKDLCTACGACSMACMNEHATNTSLIRPLRTVCTKEYFDGQSVRLEFISSSCIHCTEPPCSKHCPEHCIERDPDLNIVLLDSLHCSGCGKCVEDCVNNAIRLYPDGKAVKCDGCISRQKKGLLPACVKACPSAALYI